MQALTAAAQDTVQTKQLSPVQRSLCFCGRPKPHCSSFLITEFRMMYRLSGARVPDKFNKESGRWVDFGGADDGITHHLAGLLEVGLMSNIRKRSAVGGTFIIAIGHNRHRAGIKARYRYWKTPRLALDLGLGMLRDLKGSGWMDDLNRRDWFVGSVGMSWKERLQFSLQYETYKQTTTQEERVHVLYGGLGAGGGHGLAMATVAIVITAALAYSEHPIRW
jgi:hypothetical protein